MQEYTYRPQGTCSTEIFFTIDDGKLHNVRFTNGCNGNLKAIGRLVEGADARQVMETLRGNLCGNRGTSCADQFSKAIEQALAGEPA